MIASNPYEGPRIPGSVGRPLPGVEARISDPETGELYLESLGTFGREHVDKMLASGIKQASKGGDRGKSFSPNAASSGDDALGSI